MDISGPGRFFKKVVDPEIWYYPSSIKSNDDKRAAVLVIPGGGYYFLAFDKEGTEVPDFKFYWCVSFCIEASSLFGSQLIVEVK